jgi:hypothetical protein
MQSSPIVGFLDELADRGAHMVLVPVRLTIDLIAFQRRHEALRHRVVTRATHVAHARLDMRRFEPLNVVAARV